MPKIREGRWDCDSCGTTEIRGRYKFCPHCGSPRPKDVQFYLPENEPEVADAKQLKAARSGPDWTCEACSQDNQGDSEFCGHCGSPRGGSKKRRTKDYGLDEVPRSSKKAKDEEVEEPVFDESQGFNFGMLKIPGIISASLATVGLALFLFLGSRNIPLIASGYEWNRTVSIEEYRTVTEDDWSIPPGGRYISEAEAIHHYDTVPSGTHEESYQDCQSVVDGTETYTCGSRDLGNGYFEDVECSRTTYSQSCTTEYRTVQDYIQVPVYETEYTYEIERWLWDRNEVTQGSGRNAYWPEFTLAEKERESGRNDTYAVIFVNNDGKTYSYSTDYETWLSFENGNTYVAKINYVGQILEIER